MNEPASPTVAAALGATAGDEFAWLRETTTIQVSSMLGNLKTVIFGHLNVRSILSSFSDFVDILTEQEYDFFAVTETWLTSSIPTGVVKVPEYNFYRCDRGRRGGIGIYIKSMYQINKNAYDSQMEKWGES
ncbi:unnamed protein product [Acanthoscelides obtectus]|uniref:Uncharacterized protein n=1 Tax=Acanthoscelides obtectus TaxID=200917 RepID=A0A9P0PUI1_ACAOB|nr:unnamed protein product [Acanthoscelides obtectus]CAK1681710.1 hypothetical protein AOBTE_LOCUS33236 [Acanthoscelides obtectus]